MNVLFDKCHAFLQVWIFDSEQLIRVILSRPPSEVHQERDEIVAELGNATHKHIVVDEIRYHVDAVGRIRMDWCDLFFHAVDLSTNEITPVNNILKVIDANYDYLKVFTIISISPLCDLILSYQ